ncbi:hypothetical protein GCM10009094_26990 [Massilia aurea]
MANRMRCAVLCAVLTLICGVAAQPLGTFTWHLSGDRCVAKVAGQPGVDKWSQQPDAAFQQRYAEGYQAGVVDATQGRLWCAPPGMKPLESMIVYGTSCAGALARCRAMQPPS